MLEKFKEVKVIAIHDMHNYVKAGMTRKEAVTTILRNIPVTAAFHNVPQEMLQEFFEWMYDISYLEQNLTDYEGV